MGYLMAHVSKLLSFQVIHCSVCSCTHLILPLNKTCPPIHLTHHSAKQAPLIFEPMIASKIWISASTFLWQWPFPGDDREAASGSDKLNSQWPLTCLTFPTVSTSTGWSGFRLFRSKVAPHLTGKTQIMNPNPEIGRRLLHIKSSASIPGWKV